MSDLRNVPELSIAESVVRSSLLPGEKFLLLSALNLDKNLLRTIFSLGIFALGLNAARMISLEAIFIPPNWRNSLWLLFQVVFIGMVSAGLINMEFHYHPGHHPDLRIEAILSILGFVLLICLWGLMIFKKKTIAITDRRIIYLLDDKIKGWINLDNLSGAELHKHKKGNWFKINFHGQPIGMNGRAILHKEIYLHNLSDPDQVKAVLDQLIKSFT